MTTEEMLDRYRKLEDERIRKLYKLQDLKDNLQALLILTIGIVTPWVVAFAVGYLMGN